MEDRRKEILKGLCELARTVAEDKYNWSEAADCFCGVDPKADFQFSPRVMDFITQAVKEKLNAQLGGKR